MRPSFSSWGSSEGDRVAGRVVLCKPAEMDRTETPVRCTESREREGGPQSTASK